MLLISTVREIKIFIIVFGLCFYNSYAQNNGIFNGGNGSGASTSCIGSWGNEVPLPIVLLSFTTDCNDQNVILKWSTATETNNDYFTIERSSDGKNWEVIGTIEGAGNSLSIKNYFFVDAEPYDETVSYYRLKQTDFDGRFTFSVIKQTNCFSNCIDNIMITVIDNNVIADIFPVSGCSEIIILSIYNTIGQLIAVKKEYVSDQNSIRLTLNRIASGLYIVHVNTTTKKFVRKIII